MVGNGGRGIFREEDEKKAHSPILAGGGFRFAGESETHFASLLLLLMFFNGEFGIEIEFGNWHFGDF